MADAAKAIEDAREAHVQLMMKNDFSQLAQMNHAMDIKLAILSPWA